MTNETTRGRYLHTLATDHDARSSLVERLRCAASILTGEAPFSTVRRVEIGHDMARELLYVAAQLCDHVRISSDGRCRYCEAVVVGAQ